MNEIEKMFAEDPAQAPMQEQQVETPADQPDKKDGDEDTGDDPQPKKNHQDRRWDKLFGKLEETTEELSELKRFKNEVEQGKYTPNTEVPSYFLKIWGDTPETREAWRLQSEHEAEKEAKILERAKSEILNDFKREKQEQERWEEFIDENLESLEEAHGVDFTSGTPKSERLKRDFLKTVADLSPKNDDGSISSYASFDKSYELWSKSRDLKDNTVAQKKDISSLSGSRSNPQPIPEQEIGEGGMWGWQKYIK